MTYAIPAIEPAPAPRERAPLSGVFCYCPHGRRAAYEALGWVFAADLGPTHGHYSVLLRWAGNGDPIEPEKDRA